MKRRRIHLRLYSLSSLSHSTQHTHALTYSLSHTSLFSLRHCCEFELDFGVNFPVISMRFININIRKLPQIILHPYKYSCDSRGYMNRIFVGIVSGNLKRASPAAASRSRTLTAAPAALTSTFPVYRRPLYRAPPAGATSGVTFVRFFSRPPKKSKEPSLRKKSQRGKYPCPACCEIFDSPKALKDHSRKSHSDLVKHDVQCSCGAYFRNMLELNEHINSGQCPHGGKRVTRRVRDKIFLDDWRRERQVL